MRTDTHIKVHRWRVEVVEYVYVCVLTRIVRVFVTMGVDILVVCMY